MSTFTLYRNTDNRIKVTATKEFEGTAITDATVTVTLKNKDDETVATASATHDSGGVYYATLAQADMADADGAGYWLVITSSSDTAGAGYGREPATVRYQGLT